MIKIERNKLGLQDYFYIGYLYLIVLGIVSDAIFYGIFGVSYLNYTTILDALISPISLLANNWILALALAIMFTLMYFYYTKWMFSFYAKMRTKRWYQKMYNIEKADKRMETLKKRKNLVVGLMAMFFLMFVCMRTGFGIGMKSQLTSKPIKPDYTLVFKDDSRINVRKLGQNSAYFFYFIPGEKYITATPISDNLKQIKRLEKKKK